MPVHQATLRFNSGEITPYLAHATDFEKHPSGAARMENFLPIPFGSVRKRPGTVWVATLEDGTRLHHFQFDTSTAYVLAFSEEALNIYDSDGDLVDTIVADFADPFALQCAHVNDVLFIASPTEAPRRLTRVAHANWTLAAIPFSYPPLRDENLDTASTLVWEAALGYVPTGTSFSVTAAKDIFDAGHVGSVWMLGIRRATDKFEVDVLLTTAATRYSSSLTVSGRWAITTFGLWYGTVALQRSTNGGSSWSDLRSWTSQGNRNISAEGEETERVLLRIKAVITQLNLTPQYTPEHRAILEAADDRITGLAEITAVTDSKHATFKAVTPIEASGTGTDIWAEGAFSTYRGFPRTLAIHERRLVFAGSDSAPLTLWCSAIDDLLNFRAGTDDDDACFVTLAGTEQHPIRWLASQRRLFVGTAGGEWVFGSDNSDDPLTPTNLLAREHTRFGAAAQQALSIHNGIFFVERQGRRLREFAYVLERETFDAADMTRLAEHITESGIVQLAWQATREPFLWAIRADGVALAFAYHREERIAAWSRHTTRDGAFRSVGVLRNESGDDGVWFAVERDGAWHLERLATGQQLVQESGSTADAHFVDSAVIDSTGEGHVVAMPAHLEGLTVSVLADGVPMSLTVENEEIVLPAAAAKVHAGLPIDSTLTMLPVDTQTREGATHARRKRANELVLGLYRSRGGAVAYDAETQPLTFSRSGDLLDAAPALFTGWLPITLPPAHLDDLDFSITHSDPHPFTLRALITRWSVHEP